MNVSTFDMVMRVATLVAGVVLMLGTAALSTVPRRPLSPLWKTLLLPFAMLLLLYGAFGNEAWAVIATVVLWAVGLVVYALLAD